MSSQTFSIYFFFIETDSNLIFNINLIQSSNSFSRCIFHCSGHDKGLQLPWCIFHLQFDNNSCFLPYFVVRVWPYFYSSMKLGSFLWCIFQASNIPFLQKMHIPFSNFHILPMPAMLHWSPSCLQFVWYSLLEIINYAISEQGQGQQFHWPAVSQGFMLFISNLFSVRSMFIISNHY